MSDHDDSLLHLDGLRDMALRAANAHEVTVDQGGLDYERFGICTSDLLAMAQGYASETLQQVLSAGGGIGAAMVFQFLAGFDLGYQSRLEVESRTMAKADIFDIEPTLDDEVQGDPTQPYDQEQDG